MRTQVSAFLGRRPCLDHGRMPTRVIATDNSKLSPSVAPTYTCIRMRHITGTHKVDRRAMGTVMSGTIRGPFVNVFNARGIGMLGLGTTLRGTGWWGVCDRWVEGVYIVGGEDFLSARDLSTLRTITVVMLFFTLVA